MLWLMLRPHQFITGAADAGVYVNLGANIAKMGSIVIHDDVLADMDPTLQQAFLRPIDNPIANSYVFPAFFVMNGGTGEIVPQFYPLHPVWQAVVYDFGGVSAELLLPGLWGVRSGLRQRRGPGRKCGSWSWFGWLRWCWWRRTAVEP